MWKKKREREREKEAEKTKKGEQEAKEKKEENWKRQRVFKLGGRLFAGAQERSMPVVSSTKNSVGSCRASAAASVAAAAESEP